MFFHLLILHCMRNEYLIFLMYHYLDLYNVNHRLPLEALSGLQYPQFTGHPLKHSFPLNIFCQFLFTVPIFSAAIANFIRASLSISNASKNYNEMQTKTKKKNKKKQNITKHNKTQKGIAGFEFHGCWDCCYFNVAFV